MGDFLALSIQLSKEASVGDALAPMFGGGFFQPVAVGAVEGHSVGDHWFLAGGALEEFLAFWLARRLPPPASITLESTPDAALNVYLQECADALKRGAPLTRVRSPFERVDAESGVTALEQKYLSEELLVPLTRWADRFRQSSIYVYGDIRLTFQKSSETFRGRAFREVSSAEGSRFAWAFPLLTLFLSEAHPDEGREIVIRTQSHVWLRQAQALAGRITPSDADENLQALASFARTLTKGIRAALPAAELHLEGSIYRREEARLRAAFQDLL